MIEGLNLTLSGEELKQFLDARAAKYVASAAEWRPDVGPHPKQFGGAKLSGSVS